MSLVEQRGSLFVVNVALSAPLLAATQAAVVEALRRYGTQQAAGVLFHVEAGVRAIDPAVPNLWLGVLEEPAVRVAAMAIVSDSLAVRMAASAFDIANILRGKPVTVKAFPANERQVAQTWLRDLVDDVNAPPVPPGPRPSI